MVAAAACHYPPDPPPREITVWRRLGTWTGRGLVQTESFISDTGQLRIRWETKGSADPPGIFSISLHSAVSGRPLVDPIERRGPGAGETVIIEDPRPFYLVIESSALEWSVSVEEGIPAVKTYPEPR